MDILTYRKTKGLTQADFAALLVERGSSATQSLVSQWEQEKTGITPDRAREIEAATAGEVRCDDLRPDLEWTRDDQGRVTGFHVRLAAAG